MIVALLVLIVFILLFGAGVVKGWLANIFGYGIGGLIVLVLALNLGSYFGEYGLFWVIGIVAALFGLAVAVEDHVRKRELRKLLGPLVPPAPPSPTRFRSQVPTREERKHLREQHRDGPRGG